MRAYPAARAVVNPQGDSPRKKRIATAPASRITYRSAPPTMTNLSTEYLGLKIASPLIVGASPFADDVQAVMLLQDMGAGAIVMRSLFEEQIYLDALETAPAANPALFPAGGEPHAFPQPSDYQLSPARYLEQVSKLKSVLSVPLIASLNGSRPGGWIDYAQRFEKAGADAIELNLYQLAADPDVPAAALEAELLETLRLVKSSVRIPVAVKLLPYFTSLANFARQLEAAGADGITLFNRLYQAKIDSEERAEDLSLDLSDSSELPARLRWLAILSPNLKCSLAASGGVHSAADAVKAIAAGADAVQLVSVLLRHGPRVLSSISEGLRRWIHDHGFESVDDLRDTMNLQRSLDPAGHERAQYQRILQNWRI